MTNFVLHDFGPRGPAIGAGSPSIGLVGRDHLAFAIKASVYFITDMGENLLLAHEGGWDTLPRYGVWRRGGDVVEVGDDLRFLQDKYDVPSSQVHVL